MKPLFARTFFLMLIPCILHAQKNISITKEPSWITVKQPDYTNTSLDKKAEDGYIDVDYERQVNLTSQTEYVHRTLKIISAAGVQNASQLSVTFDPAYEHLAFHSIKVIRNNAIENKLDLSKIKTVHEEDDLENYIYNGNLKAVVILEDIRPGDVIDYSYSTIGFNPIFRGKYAQFFMTGFSVPVYQFYYKLITNADRNITLRSINEAPEPTIKEHNKIKTYEWTKLNAEPVKQEDKTPSWYDPYPQIMVSDYISWKEVNDWALQLFPSVKPTPALAAETEKINNSNATTEKKIVAALRFVQDDIRYMGIETGIHSHKPATPAKVFQQRFGDCKEKSYLLCTMLQAMHIDATPVLINTDYKKTIQTWLPAAIDFDHATVRVTVNNKTYYLDPTISYQRGSLDDIFYPDYQVGLVLTDTTTALTTIPFKNKSIQEVKDVFTVDNMYGKGKLMVTTISKGFYADNARDNFKNNSYSELLNDYRKFYAYYYEQISADSINTFDDENTGTFTSIESYTIPDFWKFDNGIKKFDTTPMYVESLVARSKDKRRNMPLEISFPEHCKETVQVTLPEDWKVTESEQHLHNSNFTYDQKFYCIGNKVYIESEYTNLKDHAEPYEAATYFRDVKSFDDNNNFDLTYGVTGKDASSQSSSSNIIISCAVVAGLIFSFVMWSQKRG